MLALVAAAATPAHAADKKPNIIFVISDDHRWDCIGDTVNNPNVSTPHLDRLAREGLNFVQGTIHIPQCSPSRAALLTGLASHANGRYSNQTSRKDVVNPDGFNQYLCSPQALANSGYTTAFVGKWHMPALPWNVGFQHIGTWMPAGAGPYKGARLAEGKSAEVTPNPGFTQSVFGDSARKFIRQYSEAKTTQPLFLWLALTAPHSPYQPNPEEAMAPYKGKGINDVMPPGFDGKINGQPHDKWVEYVTAITAVDNEIGQLRQTLEDTGLSSNTVVVFIGDNGYMMGSRGWNGKVVPYEDSVRVPFIIWGPGVFAGKGKTQASASSLDLPVTFMKLAGAQPPKEWHGRDLTPVLADGQPHDITYSVSVFPDTENWKFPEVAYRTVRTTDSKLIVWDKTKNKAPEFYDLAADPRETKNLYADADAKPRVEQLQKILDDWMTRTGDTGAIKGPLNTGDDEKSDGKKAGNRKKKRNAAAGDDD